jgi:hypothetical protein
MPTILRDECSRARFVRRSRAWAQTAQKCLVGQGLRSSREPPSRRLTFADNISRLRITPWEMRLSPGKRNRRALIAGIMLVAFALRALIPAGFMPASGRPFSLEICWDGLPAGMLVHSAHHHSGSPAHSDHCVFGTACSAGPTPHPPLPSDFLSAQQLRAVAFASIAAAVRVVHLPQSRAPPALS